MHESVHGFVYQSLDIRTHTHIPLTHPHIGDRALVINGAIAHSLVHAYTQSD